MVARVCVGKAGEPGGGVRVEQAHQPVWGEFSRRGQRNGKKTHTRMEEMGNTRVFVRTDRRKMKS